MTSVVDMSRVSFPRVFCVMQSTGSAGYGADGLPTSSSNMYDAHMR